MKKIIAEISARHIHISRRDLDRLFGRWHTLRKRNDISQPGEFAAQEMVEVAGPKGHFKKVRIVGPIRRKTQVELSVSDCHHLGIKPVLRVSGDLMGAGPIVVKGPKGAIRLKNAAIAPKRHLHISTAQAKAWKLKNRQLVKVLVKGHRGLIFDEVVVRTGNFTTRLHLDTDEGNAAGLKQGQHVWLDI